ncbi:MAG: DUF86 domain-containing protein [Acidobacteriota bacterium]
MSKRRRIIELRDYLNDILEMIADIGEFTKSLTFEEFKRDKKTVYAVIRCLEVIGEASKQIPSNIKNHHKQIPWGDIATMRNKLIHEYFGADVDIIWHTFQEDLRPLEAAIKEIKKEFSD